MVKKNKKKIEKKQICILISRDTLEKLNHELVNIYSNVFGHIGESVEEGILLWIDEQKSKKIMNDGNVEN